LTGVIFDIYLPVNPKAMTITLPIGDRARIFLDLLTSSVDVLPRWVLDVVKGAANCSILPEPLIQLPRTLPPSSNPEPPATNPHVYPLKNSRHHAGLLCLPWGYNVLIDNEPAAGFKSDKIAANFRATSSGSLAEISQD